MTNGSGVEIEKGDFVVAGEGVDRDYGRVMSVNESAATILVAWHQGVTTPCDPEDCEIYTESAGAEEAAFGTEAQRRTAAEEEV